MLAALIIVSGISLVLIGILIRFNIKIAQENEQLIVRNRWYFDMDRKNSDVYHKQCREIRALENRRHRCNVYNTSCCDTTGDNLERVTDQ